MQFQMAFVQHGIVHVAWECKDIKMRIHITRIFEVAVLKIAFLKIARFRMPCANIQWKTHGNQ